MTKRKAFPTQTPGIPVRPVVGFEGLYSVSADGRVWSEPRVVPHRTSGQLQVGGKWVMRAVDRRGYVFVLMYRNAQQFTKRVHQLVAQAWISMPPEGRECINHKNGVKTDNRAENLEWVNHSENNLHARRTGLNKGPGSALAARQRAGAACFQHSTT